MYCRYIINTNLEFDKKNYAFFLTGKKCLDASAVRDRATFSVLNLCRPSTRLRRPNPPNLRSAVNLIYPVTTVAHLWDQ